MESKKKKQSNKKFIDAEYTLVVARDGVGSGGGQNR